jgi:multiple sugar transport system permease protein
MSMPHIIVPLFIVVRELGLFNSVTGIIAPMVFQAFALFLLRQFYAGMPKDLEKAARMGGCGPIRTHWFVALPLSRPLMAALATFLFLGAWNAFLWPLSVTRESSHRVGSGDRLAPGRVSRRLELHPGGFHDCQPADHSLFLLFQKQIIEPIKTSGLK